MIFVTAEIVRQALDRVDSRVLIDPCAILHRVEKERLIDWQPDVVGWPATSAGPSRIHKLEFDQSWCRILYPQTGFTIPQTGFY